MKIKKLGKKDITDIARANLDAYREFLEIRENPKYIEVKEAFGSYNYIKKFPTLEELKSLEQKTTSEIILKE